ncbi:MAG: restriction endonuclease subunit S [Treponema sp.]|nr:restriction endonuclease subunit S [Treponema sp.]
MSGRDGLKQKPEARALIVPKEKIAGNGEYNLTGERYRAPEPRGKQKWPMARLGDVCEVIAGQSPDSKYYNENGIGTPFYQGKTEFTERYIGSPVIWTTQETKTAEKDDILISVRAPVGPVNIAAARMCIGRGLAVIRPSSQILLPYLFEVLKSQERNIKGNGGAVFDSISKKDIERITIPLPPLEIQREIAAEIEAYQKVIDGALQAADNWKPRIEPDPAWPLVRLGDVCGFIRGPFGGSLKKEIFVKSGYLVYEQYHAINNDFNFCRYFIDENKFFEMKRFEVKTDDLIISCSGTMGKIAIIPKGHKKGIINQALLKLTPEKNKIISVFLKNILESNEIQKKYFRDQPGVAIQNVASVKTLKEIKMALPPLSIQQEIAAEIEAERKIIDGCRELSAKYKAKIKKLVDGVWCDQ